MKFRFAALAATALFTSTVSFAGVVTGSSNVEFLAVDGQKASQSLLKDTRSFNINDTQTHQVVVRVSEVVRAGSDRNLFESDPIVVTFQGLTEDIVISAPRLETERDADKFKRSPTISVKTATGTEISTKQEYLKQEGFLPNYNASGAKAAVPAFASASLPATMPNATIAASGKVQKGKVTVQGENAAEQMLQYWFQQADKETRQRFLKWAEKQ